MCLFGQQTSLFFFGIGRFDCVTVFFINSNSGYSGVSIIVIKIEPVIHGGVFVTYLFRLRFGQLSLEAFMISVGVIVSGEHAYQSVPQKQQRQKDYQWENIFSLLEINLFHLISGYL